MNKEKNVIGESAPGSSEGISTIESWVPIELIYFVQARVYRPSSRESLLNSLSVYLCIVFDVIIIIILYVEFVMFWVCDVALNEYLYCCIIW